jgi:hypothetical protein
MSVLKRVPNQVIRGDGVDSRRQFFIDNANSTKYYYMPIGDSPQHPNRNTLVPLGTFLGFINYRGQVPVPDEQYSNGYDNRYVIRFSNYPYNAENGFGAIGMDGNTLVYTDQPPAAGSVPLHYYDYIQLTNPEAFDENGRPTYDERFPTAFGDGENGMGVQTFRQSYPQLEQSRLGAANFVAKSGGRKKTRNRKNIKLKKTRKHRGKRRNR